MNSSVTVIIPTLLKNSDYLVECLHSILNQDYPGKVKVVVVCNTTKQKWQERAALHTYKKQVQWLFLNENTGFTGAVNAGLELAKEDVVLLNDDATVERSFLSELVRVHEEKHADMVAANIFLSSSKEVDSQGFSFFWRGKAPALNNNNLVPDEAKDYWLNQKKFFPQSLGHSTFWQEPFGPDAAAAFYSYELISRLQGLQPEFFAYLEDVELALRARQQGFFCGFASQAVVFHHKHATSGSASHFKVLQDAKNWWRIVLFSYPRRVWSQFGGEILLERARNVSGVLKSWSRD